MYCKAGVACTNPEVYGDIKRGRRLAPSKGIVCPRCQGKCCNEACLEKHKCKQRARPSSSVGMRVGQHARWQGLDPTAFDPTGGLLDPNMALALARAGQGGLLLPQGGNMMPVIPILPLPLMFNAAALQQAGMEGGLDPAQLQAALAAANAMGVGGAAGLSAPMMLPPLGNPGTPTADAAAAGVSQALQLAQLQQLQAAGLGAGPLLQLTVQPDGSTGLMQTAAGGQRLALPPGLMQGMPLQLPGGLQLLSAEQLGLAAADGSGSLPLMQVMPDGTTGAVDQATMDAAMAAAAAAGGLGPGGLMAGLTANLQALAGVTGSEAQALLEHQQQQLELNAAAMEAAAAAAAAAAGGGIPAGMDGAAGVDPGTLDEAAAAAAAAAAASLPPAGYAASDAPLADPNIAAALAASQAAQAEVAQQQMEGGAAVSAPGGPEGVAAAHGQGLPPTSGAHNLAGADAGGLMLPAIAPLQMTPDLAAAFNAPNDGRGLYNAEEDTAAAALMSLATDKKNKAAAAAAAARAAAVAADEGIIPQAVAAQALEQAKALQAEAEAEAEAEAKQQQQQQLQMLQGHQPHQLDVPVGVMDAANIKAELGITSDEQLQQLQVQLLQQQQLQMLQQQAEQQQMQHKGENLAVPQQFDPES